MNCEQVCHLIDDYLENRLGHYERQRLENHVAFCQSCADELRSRPAFESTMLRSLAASVQHLHVSPEASRRIVHAAQGSVARAIWANRAMWAVQALAAVAAVALLVFGVLSLTGQIQLPPVLRQVTQPQASQPTSSLISSDMFIEPRRLNPGEPVTITVLLLSDLPHTLGAFGLDLEIDGPTGYYRFALAASDPVPAHGVSALQVTPDLLAEPCQEQYRISPTDIFGVPGVYTIRATLFVPTNASGR